MIRLTFINGNSDLKIREFATMRDGCILVKVSDKQGKTIWVDADGLEVVKYD